MDTPERACSQPPQRTQPRIAALSGEGGMQYFIICEQRVLCKAPSLDSAIFLTVATYYCYNLEYPAPVKGLNGIKPEPWGWGWGWGWGLGLGLGLGVLRPLGLRLGALGLGLGALGLGTGSPGAWTGSPRALEVRIGCPSPKFVKSFGHTRG